MFAFLCVALGIAICGIALSGSSRYRAQSIVLVRAYTNAVFTRSFEEHVSKTIPGVLRLEVTPIFSVPSPGIPVTTNGTLIHIFVIGSTSADAQRAANKAAERLLRIVLEDFRVNGSIIDRANTARRYSVFHDSFQPGVERFFKY